MLDTRTDEVTVRELAELYADLGRRVAGAAATEGPLGAVTRVAIEAVPGAQYATITRATAKGFQTVSSTDQAAAAADRLQYDLDSGPCVDAIKEDTIFISLDLGSDARWPEFGPQAVQSTGVRSLLAVRMLLEEDQSAAALNIYSAQADAFADNAPTVALLLATHGSIAVMRFVAREKASNLERALVTNREIGVAMGVLMATHKIDRDQSFDLLRITSQQTHRKLYEIARDVADTGVLDVAPRQLVPKRPLAPAEQVPNRPPAPAEQVPNRPSSARAEQAPRTFGAVRR